MSKTMQTAQLWRIDNGGARARSSAVAEPQTGEAGAEVTCRVVEARARGGDRLG